MDTLSRQPLVLGLALLVLVIGVRSSDLFGHLGSAIVDDVLFGRLISLGVASFLAGLVAGGVVLYLTRLLGFSWAPPRLIAARLFRRSYDDVGWWGVVTAHFALTILGLLVAGGIYLGGSFLLAGPAGASLLGTGPLYVTVLLILCGSVVWAAFAYWWLPTAADAGDCPEATLRRQSAVVGVLFAVVAGPVFAFLLFLAMMAVAFR